MRAFVAREAAGWSASWEDVAEPVAASGEVVVEVRAAALAWSDVLQMRGSYAGAVPEPPFVCGHEFAGVVVGVALDSTYAVGERVFGFVPRPGAFAERIAVAAPFVRRIPDEVAFVPAAAVTTAYVTADLALFQAGGLAAGGSVLVHAAAGGVGRAAVQLARLAGAGVIVATAGSAARRADAAALGADETAGYDDFPEVVHERTAGRGVDVVLESVGGDVFDRSLDVIAPFGRLVTIGASSGTPPRRLKLPVVWQGSLAVVGVHVTRLLAGRPQLVEPAWDRVLAHLARGEVDAGVGLVVRPDDLERGIVALTQRSVAGRVVIDFG